MRRPAAIVSVINDLVTDNRVQRACGVLLDCGYDVKLIGRKLPDSLPLPSWNFKTVRMVMIFRKGPLFYFFFNVRLFFKLLFSRAGLLYANDLDTLAPNYLVSKLRGIPLVYDSHELFCDVPELLETPFKRRIWQKLEKFIVPKLKCCITVNESLALELESRYRVKFHSIRNIPAPVAGFLPKTRKELGLPENKKIILLQGAGINVQRGAEELVESMASVKDAVLLIIGSGDVWDKLRSRSEKPDLSGKVIMMKKMPKSELLHYTFNADLGLTLDKNTNLNYYYSLPNKVFDYLQAGVPILASRLPEIEKTILACGAGEFIDGHSPDHIADRLNDLLPSARLKVYRINAARCGAEMNWDKEKQKLVELVNGLNKSRP